MIKILTVNPEAAAAIVSAVLTALALFAGWRSNRRNGLRREGVLDWANESITALQTLLLLSIHGDPPIPAAEAHRRRVDLLIQTERADGRTRRRSCEQRLDAGQAAGLSRSGNTASGGPLGVDAAA